MSLGGRYGKGPRSKGAPNRAAEKLTALAGVWTIIGRKTIATAVQTYDFPNVLADNRYIGYRISARLINGEAATSSYGLRLNGGAAGVNRQKFTVDNATVVAARDTTNVTAILNTSAAAGKYCDLEMACLFPTQDGVSERFFFCKSSKAIADTDQPDLFHANLHLTTPAVTVQIVSAGIGCDTASGIGVGSILELEAMGAW